MRSLWRDPASGVALVFCSPQVKLTAPCAERIGVPIKFIHIAQILNGAAE